MTPAVTCQQPKSPPEERRAWIELFVAVVGYPAYLVLLLTGKGEAAWTDTGFAWPMLWTVAGSITVSMILSGLARVYTDKESNDRDERDRRIGQWSGRAGTVFLIAGSTTGLGLAMLAADPFWIANALFLGFYASAAASAIVKIIAYRRGLPDRW